MSLRTLPRGFCPSVYETKRGVPEWVWPYESCPGVKEFHRRRFGTTEEASCCTADTHKLYVYATASCVWNKHSRNNQLATSNLETLRDETEVDFLCNRKPIFINLCKS